MSWYQYVAAFFSGAFLANFVPHFVSGVSGDRFPTPFSRPPGRGLSSPVTNVLWALLNLVVGYILARVGWVSVRPDLPLLLWFAGFAVLSLMLSVSFQRKAPR